MPKRSISVEQRLAKPRHQDRAVTAADYKSLALARSVLRGAVDMPLAFNRGRAMRECAGRGSGRW